MTTTVLPTPTIRRGDRTARINYPTGVTTPEGEEVVAQVFCSHDTSRKVFSASLKSVKVGNSGGFRVESFWVFSGVAVARVPVARYSAKAFEAFIADVQAALPALVENDEKAAAIFRGEGE